MLQIVQLLGDAGLRVIYLPDDGVASEPHTSRLREMSVTVLAGRFDAGRWLAANGGALDRVLIARPEIARRYLPTVRASTGARVAYFTQDLHYLRESREYELDGDPGALRASRRLRPIEQRIFETVDAVATPSSDEAEIIRGMVPGRTVVVLAPFLTGEPDTAVRRATAAVPGAQNGVVFVGGFAHRPNVDAVRFLVRDILPVVWRDVPEATALIVGPDPPPEVTALASDRVRILGFLPDLAGAYDAARMSISPLRFGAGVKGKILSSVEAGVPVITTSIGNEGIGLRDGIDAFIADDTEGLAAAAVRLFRDPALGERMAAAARGALGARFTRQAAREALDVLLDLRTAGGAP